MTTQWTSEIDTVEQLITGPTVEPLDLDEVKKQRRFSSSSLDTMFDLQIAAARQYWCEQTGRAQITETRDYLLDAFPYCDSIELPRPPLQSVVGVYYVGADGTEVQFDAANYTVVTADGGHLSKRGRIALVSGASWPTPLVQPKAVRIRFKAGYGDAPGSVPELERFVLHTLVGHFHNGAESVAPTGLVALPMGANTILMQAMFASQQTLVPRRAAPSVTA